MKTRKQRNVLPICLMFLTCLAFFPGMAALCPANEPPDNTLNFGIHVSAMGNLDPHFAAGSQDRAFADMVFNGLLRYTPGHAPRIEPDLAAAIPVFRIEHGQQIWQIRLREGVSFHPAPGFSPHELTADDVIFSLEKAADKTFCAYAGDYTGIHMEKTGRYSLEITLDQPISPILFFPKITNYGGGFILSKRSAQGTAYEKFKTHPVGTGPFTFHAHTPGTLLALKANPDYFRGRPKLDGVNFAFVPDLEKRAGLLKQGQLDVITGSGEEEWIRAMEQVPGIQVDTHGAGEVGSVYFNTRIPPMDDIRVRKAIALALDRSEFLKLTSPRIAGPVFSQVPAAFLPGGLDQSQAEHLGIDYKLNLEKARQLLAEAGFDKGFDLELVSSEKRIYHSSYLALKRQLEKIQIRCHISQVPHSEMHKIIRKTPKALVIYYAWRPNADVYLTRFFHSDSIVVTGRHPDTNFSGYAGIDPLIESARLATDIGRQIRLWNQAQIKVLTDLAAYPVMFTRQCYARTRRLEYGHDLVSTMALYPQFTERTFLKRNDTQ